MLYLIKSLFRYTFKNKLSTCLLSLLAIIGVFLLLSLSLLSNNLQGSYNKLVNEGNLGNIVINENYSNSIKNSTTVFDEEAAKLENERLFKEWLNTEFNKTSKDNFEFREFTSLDYTNTANGKAMKVIAYDNNFTVDKLVIYQGQKLYNDTFNFGDLIANANWKSDELSAQMARREIVYLATKAYWTDDGIAKTFSNASNPNSAISLLTSNNQSSQALFDPKTWSGKTGKIGTLGKYIQAWFDPSTKYYRPLLSKGYRLNFEIYVGVSKPKVVGNIINYGSQFAVIPDYVLQDQHKKILPLDWYQKIQAGLSKENYFSQTEFENKVMNAIPEECKIYVDALPYVIVGTGISPDFMYPVYSLERITPNIHEEALLYTTQGGFDNSLNANRSNPVDKFIVAKCKTDPSLAVKIINQEIPKYMTTAGQTWCYLSDDPNNTMQPTAIRLLFLPKLVQMQTIISNVLSIFILILGITIFIIMLKKFIRDNQVSLAILRSNGYQKRSVIWSTALFAVIPSAIGGIIGYLIAWITQGFMLNIYSFYWIIPTALSSYNVLILLGAILIPLLILGSFCVIAATIIIRRPPGRLMNESSKFSVSRLSKIMSKPIPSFKIMPKFRLSVAFSSFSRLLVLVIMLSLSSSALIFAFGTTNKFSDTKQITYVDKKYNMNFELETPTLQGGQYFRSTFENAGKPIFDDKQQLLNFNVSAIDDTYGNSKGLDKKISTSTPINTLWSYFRGDKAKDLNAFGQIVNNLMPSMNDGTWQTDDINYLKNKMSTQIYTDANAAGNNPWDIARSLAPENVQNYSKKLTTELMQKVFNDPTIYFTPEVLKDFPTWPKASLENKTMKQILLNSNSVKAVDDNSNPSIITFQNEEDGKWYTLDSTNGLWMKNDFIDTMGYLMTVATEKNYSDLFYKLVYDDICMDETDETYTYVNTQVVAGMNTQEPVKLIGIKPDSTKIELKNDKEENLNDLLWINQDEKLFAHPQNNEAIRIHDIYSHIDTTKPQTIIINKSAAYQYGLKIGDIITFDPTNEATRFNPHNVYGEDINKQTYQFKVVGIYRSAQNPEFYINQRVANKMLHLDNPKILAHAYYDPQTKLADGTWKQSYQIDPFNAFFTSSENPKIVTSTLTLYSITGLGIADDKFANKPTQRIAIEKSIGLNTTTLAINEPKLNFLQQGKLDLAYALGFVNADQTQGDITQLNNYVKQLITTYKNEHPADNNGAVAEAITGEILKQLINTYNEDVFYSTVHNVGSVQMFQQLFDNTSKLCNSLLIIIITIIFIISILSSITIALDLLNSSLALAGVLKALGFSDLKNTITFTSIFIPSLILASGISIGLSFFLFDVFTKFVYSFSNILLDLSLLWYLPIASLAIIGVLIILILAYYYKVLKNKNIPESIARY